MFTPHYLAAFGGKIGGVDQWACSFRVRALNGDKTSAQLDDHIDAVDNQINDRFANDNRSGIPAGVTLDFFKFNAITALGKYRDSTTHVVYFKPGINGGTSSQVPEFLCTSVSLLTDADRGRAHRGRIYWPNFGLPMDGNIPPSVQDGGRLGAANWTRDLIRDVCEVFPGGSTTGNEVFRPIIASKLDGTIRDVTHIAVGNILDYQSRRKHSFQEVYHTIEWTP